jgi:hypothetical protein
MFLYFSATSYLPVPLSPMINTENMLRNFYQLREIARICRLTNDIRE